MASPNPQDLSALELSAVGTRMIQVGNYGKAVSSFSQALSKLQNAVAIADQKRICKGLEDERLVTLNFGFSAPQVAPKTGSDDDNIFIFQDPIRVSCSRSSAITLEQCKYKSLVRLSNSLLFNLALAHHLQAQKMQDEGRDQGRITRLLTKAIALYNLANSFLTTELASQVADSDGIILLGTNMAIANNLGYIHQKMGSTSQSQESFETLLSITSVVMTRKSAAGAAARDGHVIPHWDEFVHTIQSRICCPHLPAKAA